MKATLGLCNPHYVKDHIYAILRQVGGKNKVAKIAVKDNKTQGKFHIVLLVNESVVNHLISQLHKTTKDLNCYKQNP